jgi:hypothetical protein
MAATAPAFGSTIGPIVSARDVEAAALATLKKWSSTYLGEAEDQHGRDRGALPRLRSYTTTNSFDKWPEDQLPCALLVCPGLAEPPKAEGNGHYRAVFAVGLAVIVSARTEVETEALAKLYVAALRTCLIQQPSLGGFAAGLDWLDESYDDLPSEDLRSLGAGQAIFAVHVNDLSRRYSGPPHPTADVPVPPYAPVNDDPVALDVAVDVINKSINTED